MKKFRILLLLLLPFLISMTESKKTTLPFKIIEATSQGWTGGIAQSGSGFKYTIKLLITEKKKVEFKKIWIKQQEQELEVFSLGKKEKTVFTKGDSLILVCNKKNLYQADGIVPLVDSTKLANPPYMGMCQVEYKAGKKTAYFRIPKFKKLMPKNFE